MDGILNIDKPSGPTSHDIVAKVRRILGQKRVGHTGTLDPLATGVLVVCVGKATRLVEYLVGNDKAYSARMVLGQTTSTCDSEGEATSDTDASHISVEMVKDVLPRFTGRIQQIPPMVSAVKHNGKRLYELARKDIEVERRPREISVHRLELTGFAAGSHPEVGLFVVCSSGTYIRTLCADIGEALGVGGHMAGLNRNRVGAFSLDDSITLEGLQQAVDEGRVNKVIMPMDQALTDMPSVAVGAQDEMLVAHGGEIAVRLDDQEGTLVRVLSEDGRLLSVGRLRHRGSESVISPEKVFIAA